VSETYIHPSAEQIAAITKMEFDGPLVMLNLLPQNTHGMAKRLRRSCNAAAQPYAISATWLLRSSVVKGGIV
jgi:hypothetical protein